jgi:hypothetical protein
MTCMLTLLDINRAIDRLGVGAFAPRALRARFADRRPPGPVASSLRWSQ